MSSPIYVQNPFEDINKWLLQQAAMKQQNEITKEQIALRKKEFEQRAQEHQFEQQKRQQEMAQTQGPQMAAQQMLQSMLAQQFQPMNDGGMQIPQGMANPAPQAVFDYAQLQKTATPDQALAAAPGALKSAQAAIEDRRTQAEEGKFLAGAKAIMSPDDYPNFENAWNGAKLTGNTTAVAELLRQTMPETAVQRLERLKAKMELDTYESGQKADIGATAVLKRHGIIPKSLPDHVPGAMKMLQDQINADRQISIQERTVRRDRMLAEAEGMAMELAVSGVPHEQRRRILASQYGEVGEGLAAKLSLMSGEAVAKATGAPGEKRGQAGIYLPAMEAGDRAIKRFSDEGVKAPTLGASLASHVPFVGQYAINAAQQQLINAGDQFAQGVLRLETGAQMSRSEVRMVARRFIPMPGDTDEAITQKDAFRKIVVESVRRASGQPFKPGQALPPGISRMVQEDIEAARIEERARKNKR